MKRILIKIDAISECVGNIVSWFTVALIIIIVFEVSLRYIFNAPTNWTYEIVLMLAGTIYIMGWCYVHLYHGHTRVDVFYMHLPSRGKLIIDVFCTFLFFFPLIGILIATSIPWFWKAWATGEKMIHTTWYPPAAPFRTMVTVGLCLFALQGVAQFIRDLALLIKGKTYD